ncbi:hypothetical protein KDV38_20010, partial [Providencia rettgeri]
MSTHDPIDLDAIKQAVFRENLPNFLNHAYFWMITDQENHVLSCSSPENVKSILNSIKIAKTKNELDFLPIELVTHHIYPIALALEVISFKMTINNQLVLLRIYDLIKNSNVKFKIFKSSLSIR